MISKSDNTISRSKVLVFAIDAPNHKLLEDWINQGSLPNLSELRNKSQCFKIESYKSFSNEHCWIPVLTGQKKELLTNYLENWDPITYQHKEISIYDWINAPLFFSSEHLKVVAFDLPAPISENVFGVQVTGFASELNECFPKSSPPELIEQLINSFGVDPKLQRHNSIFNTVTNREGLSWIVPSCYDIQQTEILYKNLLSSVNRRTEASLSLMKNNSWDLFITAYSEIHSASHCLWHLGQPHPLSVLINDRHDPTLEIFKSIDQSIYTLIKEAGKDVTVVLFTLDSTVVDSLENIRTVFLPEFIYRWNFPDQAALAYGDSSYPPTAPRFDYRQHWKHEIWSLRTLHGENVLESPSTQEKKGDPLSWCPANWYKGNWPRMRAFALPSVADGSIRLNIIGREANGHIEPKEFISECNRLTDDLLNIYDPRSGRKIVEKVIRVRNDPFDNESSNSPADLIVVCHENGPVDVIDTPKFGRIGPIPYFRTSSHQAHGKLIENLLFINQPNHQNIGWSNVIGQLEDIPATLLNLLDMDIPTYFDGQSLINHNNKN